jgi:hypothetical protein
MKIRDGHATINGDITEHEMPSGSVEIIADDGRTLLCITMQKDGSLRIHAGHVCKHGGKLLDDRMDIRPIASNVIEIARPIYG